MKLKWLGYLVYSLGNCTMKLCIETGVMYRNYSLRPQILLFLADFRQISVINKRPFYPQLIWVPPFNHAR